MLTRYLYNVTRPVEISPPRSFGCAMTPNSTESSELLRRSGLRLTRQRVALADLLFGNGDRHVTAEELYNEAADAHIQVSLATVYNTLNLFTAAGLLREVAIEGAKAYFDTNTSNHSHYYFEEEARLMDIEAVELRIEGLPALPEGRRIDRIDITVRLCRSGR